ncbi:unnamed protein product [Caenorhabditis auriculariae]|uniref:Uncharacterized protein n=1 Tax=Caenorhabditis auriculariae TaxID=2777116 RepID=A0A8S1HDY2_9PELO|nr:unnamed protein product [Caenorhabditis auriculariae]
MGTCQSVFATVESKEQYKISKRIDKELEKKSDGLLQKILLLGPGESGKSTCLKQMRLMMHIGFTGPELAEKKALIYVNIVQGAVAVLDFMEMQGLKLRNGYIDEALQRLWTTEQFQKAYESRGTYHVHDSIAYFFENLERISADDYVPNSTDILHTRILRVCDVGGQRSERKKWIHCFEGVNAVLFVVAVSEFDQVVREDNQTNRIEEALKLFYEIVNSQYFKEASMILFLNKKDLFAKKVQSVEVATFFRDFSGENSYENAIEYFRKKFKRCILSKTRKPYIHETCAISNTVQIVINSVIDTIIQENLKDTGMI